MKPKIIFFGSDNYSVLVLNQICNDKRFKVVGISTHLSPSPVKDYAKILFEIKFTVTKKFDQKFQKLMQEMKPDVGVLASYGKILPKAVLKIPKYGILNIHPSLLPKYRGPSPVQMAILNGEKETGVTIFKMDEKVDHGPILSQFIEEIKPNDTAQSLYERLFETGAKVLLTILPAYLKSQIELREQDHKKATYTKKLTRDDGKIDWKKPDSFNQRFIRAMYPWPGAWCWIKIPNRKLSHRKHREEQKAQKLSVPSKKFGSLSDQKAYSVKRLKILRAHLEAGKLIFDQVQLEGKKPVTFKQFQEGYPKTKLI